MTPVDVMLVGRESELAALAELTAGAREGRSAVVVLRGDPGIGKSALIERAVALADGFQVLRTRGVESESEIAFSGLQELVAPVLDLVDRLPTRQRAVLSGALAIGPTVPGDPLAVRVAALGLLGAAAENRPVIAVVDDAHWLDSASADALAFAARRLDREGVVVLFAVRDAQPSAFDPSGLHQLTLRPLAEGPARELIEQGCDQEIADEVLQQLVSAAAGIPLALLELPGALSPGQLSGREPVPEPLPVGAEVRRAFTGRLERLPRSCRQALLITAASGHDEQAAVATALRNCGLSETSLEPAERAGLVVVAGGGITFHHPLIRSVVYERSTGGERRAAHAALAASSADGDRRSWHAAAACPGPDDRVARQLDDAAGRAAARGGLAAAARAYQRAAELSAGRGERAGRLFAAAASALASGKLVWAAELVTEGLPLAESPTIRADFRQLAAVVERERGSVLESRTMLWDGAAAVAPHDPTRATLMLIDATCADTMRGDLRAAADSGWRARVLAADDACSPAVRRIAAVACDWVANRRGETTAEDVEMEAVREDVVGGSELPPAAAMAVELLWAGWYAQQIESAAGRPSNALDHAIATARERGALAILPYLLGQGSQLDFREGRWVRASARASEAAGLAGGAGLVGHRAWSLVNLAWVEAAQGHEPDCRAHAAEAAMLSTVSGTGALMLQVHAVLGLLELGLGRIAAAVDELEQCSAQAAAAGHGHPNVLRFEPDLVEALHAAGREREAGVAADLLGEIARRVASPFGMAAAARCRGLLAAAGTYEREFQVALALHDSVASAFERARTQLCYGERLRRARRRTDSQPQLTQALATFEQLGALPWAERARREVAASGATVRPRSEVTAAARLTPQELRVALTVAGGVTVREAATALFLSPKTVEAHLGRPYRKLGVRNRAQLVTAMIREGGLDNPRRDAGLDAS